MSSADRLLSGAFDIEPTQEACKTDVNSQRSMLFIADVFFPKPVPD